jgi:uncharacterized protein Yka (UPF0111/DUF47 family)
MNIEDLLNKLDDLVDKSWSLPLTGGKRAVDSEKVREIIDDIRLNIPLEIRQAKAIVADRTEIIVTAKREADNIIRVAEERARHLVSQEEVVRQANEKATEMVSNAQQRVREMRQAASEFSETMLKRSEEGLIASLSEIRQARQALKSPIKKDNL